MSDYTINFKKGEQAPMWSYPLSLVEYEAEIERLQSVCDQNVSEIELLRNRIAELEERLDIDYGNMYDVIVAENERLIKENRSLKEKNG